jgi:hypothetical protein
MGFRIVMVPMGSILAMGADRGGILIMGIEAQKEEWRGQWTEWEL